MPKITARFYVNEVTTFAGATPQAKIKLTPSYANGANKEWAVATPSGVIELNVQNPTAVEQFKAWQASGANLGITFEEVPTE